MLALVLLALYASFGSCASPAWRLSESGRCNSHRWLPLPLNCKQHRCDVRGFGCHVTNTYKQKRCRKLWVNENNNDASVHPLIHIQVGCSWKDFRKAFAARAEPFFTFQITDPSRIRNSGSTPAGAMRFLRALRTLIHSIPDGMPTSSLAIDFAGIYYHFTRLLRKSHEKNHWPVGSNINGDQYRFGVSLTLLGAPVLAFSSWKLNVVPSWILWELQVCHHWSSTVQFLPHMAWQS